MKKVLFVTYGGGHMKIIEPIAKKLLQDKNIDFKILALTSANKYLVNSFNKNIVKKTSDYSFLFDDMVHEVLQYGLEFLEDNYTPNGLVTKKETIYYIGLSFYDLIQRVGKAKAYELYKYKKRQSFLPVSIIKKILEYEEIDIVVSTTSPRFEQASLIAGNQLNIKTLQVLDLFAEVYPLPEANHIVVMNESVKNGLISQNLYDKNYYTLGQPAIENTVKNIEVLNRGTLNQKVNINTKNKILLFATQRLSVVNKEFKIISSLAYNLVYDDMFNLLNNLTIKYNLNIIIRLHPNEYFTSYEKYFIKYPSLLYINDKLSLEESIALSDILLTKTSTVAVEAISAKKQVFTYKHKYDDFYSVPTFSKLPFIFSDGFEELENNLCEYLDNPSSIDGIENFMPIHAAKNIAKLIKEL